MRPAILTITSALLLMSGAVAANATQTPAVDAGPVVQNSDAMAAADMVAPMNIRQQIESQLTKAGYTDCDSYAVILLRSRQRQEGQPDGHGDRP